MKDLKTIIAEHPFAAGLKPAVIRELTRCGKEVTFRANEILFREGEVADRFFLIESGEVALETQTDGPPKQIIDVCGAGDVVGWSWLFAPFMWHFQARALQPTRAVKFDAPHLLVCCEENHELGFQLMKRLAQVVIHRLQAARKRLIKDRAA